MNISSIPSKAGKKSGAVQCQRCLKYGHWTYECKNEAAYVYRPSRTMQYKEPSLKQALNQEKAPKGPKITDGDLARTVWKDEDSSVESEIHTSDVSSDSDSDSSSSSSSNSSAEKSNHNSSSRSNSSDSESKSIKPTPSKEKKLKKEIVTQQTNQSKNKKKNDKKSRSRSRSSSVSARKNKKTKNK